MIKAVMLDFGGVLAEEGFRQGLIAIAVQNRLDPEFFFSTAAELVYSTGYVTGQSDENAFWDALRRNSGITAGNSRLRKEILTRFVLRPEMLEYVKKLKISGLSVAILSDQTNWLEELDNKTPFFHLFDHVFNSYRLRKGKKDPSIFSDACSTLGVRPDEAVFVDDNADNIKRALSEGLNVVHFRDKKNFEKEMRNYI